DSSSPSPSPSSSASSAGAEADVISPRDRSVITLLLVSAFVLILNETTLSVALPPIMADLHLRELTAQWLTTCCMLCMAVVSPLTGVRSGRCSTRQVFSSARTLFTIGTVVCVLSPGLLPLLAGRIVQACDTGIMMPRLLTTVINLVPPSKHGR